jgi:site-specific DNA recombinase
MFVNQNMSLNGIARTLNKEKIPTKQNVIWKSPSVSGVLKNINLIGNIRYGVEQPDRYFETKGKHEAIISTELFQEAQLLLEKNKIATPTKKGTSKNYYVGFLFCGLCGKRLATHMVKKKGGSILCNFKCLTREAGACTAKMITINKIEKAVAEYINNIPIAKTTTESSKQEEQAATRIAELQSRLAVLEAKDKTFLDSYIEDNFTLEEYRGVKKLVDKERKEIQAEIQLLKPKEKSKNHVEPKTKEEIIQIFKTEWQGFNDVEKRQFLLKHINKIEIINHPIKNKTEGRSEVVNIEFNTN